MGQSTNISSFVPGGQKKQRKPTQTGNKVNVPLIAEWANKITLYSTIKVLINYANSLREICIGVTK